MKSFYLRWAILIILFGCIGFLGLSRYNRDVRTISPSQLLSTQPNTSIRLLGMVSPGTLVRGEMGRVTRFDLSGDGEKVAVQLANDDEETLRELKTVVILGKWDETKKVLNADEIALVPNYGFITSAYLFSLLPLAFFLFYMERKVSLLYIAIKEEKVYEPEASA
ncbi:MAG: cytochrome c maturation protein CcmE [Nitrospiria bacterium]